MPGIAYVKSEGDWKESQIVLTAIRESKRLPIKQ